MPPVRERSAGAVVFRRAPTGRSYLLLRYGAGHWGFPKGHIEGQETEVEAALREVEEETGIPRAKLRFVEGFRGHNDYRFRRGRQLVLKGVDFFVMESETDAVKISHEHTDFAWLPFEAARKRISFEGPRRLLEEVDEFLRARDAAASNPPP